MAGVPEPRGGALPADELPRMSLLDHLEDLRKRIVYSVASLFVAMLGCFHWAPEICRFFARPIYERHLLPEGQKLAFLGVTDAFLLYVKTALLAGAFLAAPVILYQVWAFISPGLYPKERRWAAPFVFLGWGFFIAGGVFAYLVAFPFAVEFLLAMGKDFMPVITAEKYYGLLLTIMLGLGLMFELPIVLVLLAKIGLVTPRFLMRNFRWAVLAIFVVSAIITPTSDIVNLCIFAVADDRPLPGRHRRRLAGDARQRGGELSRSRPARRTLRTVGPATPPAAVEPDPLFGMAADLGLDRRGHERRRGGGIGGQGELGLNSRHMVAVARRSMKAGSTAASKRRASSAAPTGVHAGRPKNSTKTPSTFVSWSISMPRAPAPAQRSEERARRAGRSADDRPGAEAGAQVEQHRLQSRLVDLARHHEHPEARARSGRRREAPSFRSAR